MLSSEDDEDDEDEDELLAGFGAGSVGFNVGGASADFSVGACFSYAEPSHLPWDNYKQIKAWCARLADVPAWKATAPKLG